MILQNDVGRSCGGCTACCKPFAIDEIGKETAAWCKHCTIGTGCNIYEDRPDACRLFACAWLNGTGDDSFRPDRLGVMIDVEDLDIGSRTVGVVHFWEVREGAIDNPLIQEMADANKDQGFVVVSHRILTEDRYHAQAWLRRDLFSGEEIKKIESRAEEGV